MTQKHILVVDDHQDIRDLLGTYLRQHDYRVTLAEDGKRLRTLLSQQAFDLVVLDLMMPGEDGLSLCRHIREISGPPVIMLTAMSEDTDCVVGLEMGADDYVTKPFVPRVLLARIKALLRRQGEPREQHAQRRYRFNGWEFDPVQRQLLREDGVVIALSQGEYKLLQVFLQQPQRVLNRDQLLTLTRGREADPFDRSIDNQVSRLRKKLEADPHNPELIKTVWGGGYLFAGRIEP